MEKNEENKKDAPLEFTELEKELVTYVTKNQIPSQLVKKLVDKLKEKNIKITRTQLTLFIEKLLNVMRTAPAKPVTPVNTNGTQVKGTPAPEPSKDQKQSTPTQPVIESADMKILVDTIEQLKNRLITLEKNQMSGKKIPQGKFVTTKDIQTLEQELIPQQLYDLQPLTELANDAENIIVLMKWLQHLVDRVGKTFLADVLSYYVDIGWITDDVRLDLLRYAKGITDDGRNKSVTGGPLALSTKDHIQSLLFIQKLKGVQVDERFIWRIDREMEKLGKTIDEYHLK
ncbi:MAG: FlaD/FlaE family flagellar protein [Methanobacteriota archaeon]